MPIHLPLFMQKSVNHEKIMGTDAVFFFVVGLNRQRRYADDGDFTADRAM